MPSAKNLSPRQLAAFTAGILAVPVALGILLLTSNWQIGLAIKNLNEVAIRLLDALAAQN